MEQHFDAALLLKGVGIAFVFQFPSGPYASLLFSCLLFRTSSSICQMLIESTLNILLCALYHVVFQQAA